MKIAHNLNKKIFKMELPQPPQGMLRSNQSAGYMMIFGQFE